ncbi:MAG: cation transporter [Marivirga sp.]|nr:cation transporter [Marivirga sp.]
MTSTISSSSKNKKNILIVLLLTGTYLVAEVIGGLLTNSLALLADAGHMLTDVGGLALAYIAIRLAERPANPRNTYGFYRMEILAAMINAVVLIGISIYILYEAYQRFKNPPEVESKAMLIVAGIGLVINLIGMYILRKGKSESLNMKGAYFEVLSDMLTSIGVIVAGIIMWTTGWYYADPILSSLIGLLILPRTWRLLKEATHVLLEGTPSDVNIEELRRSIKEIKNVYDVHDLHVWSLTSGVNAMSVHIVLDKPERASNQMLELIDSKIKSTFRIAHTTLQLELLEGGNGLAEKEIHL